jgi:hypothetical protein
MRTIVLPAAVTKSFSFHVANQRNSTWKGSLCGDTPTIFVLTQTTIQISVGAIWYPRHFKVSIREETQHLNATIIILRRVSVKGEFCLSDVNYNSRDPLSMI